LIHTIQSDFKLQIIGITLFIGKGNSQRLLRYKDLVAGAARKVINIVSNLKAKQALRCPTMELKQPAPMSRGLLGGASLSIFYVPHFRHSCGNYGTWSKVHYFHKVCRNLYMYACVYAENWIIFVRF
jgi:hypothetical protein